MSQHTNCAQSEREAQVREAKGLCHMAGSQLPEFMDELFKKYVEEKSTPEQLHKEFENRFFDKYMAQRDK